MTQSARKTSASSSLTRRASRVFFTGLAVVGPALITIALIGWLLRFAESLFARAVVLVLGDYYYPGMGTVLGLATVFLAGLLARAFVFRALFAWGDAKLNRIPLVKTVYGAVRDLTTFFSGDKARRFNKVVCARLPGINGHLLGFVTREDFGGLPEGVGGPDVVAVYVPMSYQIGGYTLILPRNQITPIDMSIEDAMRFAVTGGMSVTSGQGPAPFPPVPLG